MHYFALVFLSHLMSITHCYNPIFLRILIYGFEQSAREICYKGVAANIKTYIWQEIILYGGTNQILSL